MMRVSLHADTSAIDRTAIEFMALIALGKVSEETATRFIDAMEDGSRLFEAASEVLDCGAVMVRARPIPQLRQFLDACRADDAEAVEASLAEIEALQ